MTDLQIDLNDAWVIKDKATQEAALGAHALGVGDTVSAREHYSEAGRLLESEGRSARDPERRNLLHFLAASQYFAGGDYAQALKLARRVEERYLPEQTRQLLRPFIRDAEERASASYLPTMRAKVHDLGVNKQYAECLELLKNHPFVLGRPQLSFARAIICEEQKRYRQAAVHHARGMMFDPDNPSWPYTASALVMWLPSDGRVDEAFEYLGFLLKEVQHPAVRIAASTLYYRKASESDGDERRNWLQKQVGFFHEAWDGFQKLPVSHQKDAHLRDLMSLCFELGAFAYWKLNDSERAMQIAKEGIEFNPTFAGLWTVGGMIQEEKRGRLEYYRQAIRLGEKSYLPHYYLAKDDLEMGHFRHALQHVDDALDRGPSPEVRGVLLGWKAICVSHADDSTVAEVADLFQKAMAMAPSVPEIRENYDIFREFVDKATPKAELATRKWSMPKIAPLEFITFEPTLSQQRLRLAA